MGMAQESCKALLQLDAVQNNQQAVCSSHAIDISAPWHAMLKEYGGMCHLKKWVMWPFASLYASVTCEGVRSGDHTQRLPTSGDVSLMYGVS